MKFSQVRKPSEVKSPLFILFSSLYTAQAVTVSIAQGSLPVILRDAGAALDAIGYLQLLFLPWALKFLWAPYPDRHAIGGFGHRRGWLLLGHLGMLSSLVLAALIPPTESAGTLIGILVLLAVCAATQDVAADALAIETVAPIRRVLVGSARSAGRTVGSVLGVGLCLPVYAAFGWTTAVLLLAGLVAMLGAPLWVLPNRVVPSGPAHARRSTVRLRESLSRPEIWAALGFLALYQPGARIGGALVGPFLIDQGLSVSEVGWVKGTGAAVLSVLAALLATPLVRRFGMPRTLAGAALLNALCLVLLALAAQRGTREPVLLAALVLLQASVLPVMLATIHAAVLSWCLPERAGTDSALFQSFNALMTVAGSVVAGFVAHNAGHAANFSLSAALVLGGGMAALACRRLFEARRRTA